MTGGTIPGEPHRTPQIPSAAALAEEIRSRRGWIPQVKLHKLLYYIQGCHLAWKGQPAFVEEIEAWERGPVVADLWRQEKYGPEPNLSREQLPDTVRNTVTNVLCRFDHMTGIELTHATHAEDPWREVTRDGRYIGSQVITHEALARFFSSESPELLQMKQALAQVRDNSLFQPDPPGALEALMSGLTPS